VPRTGIVADVGWDNMLAVLKERGQKVGEIVRNGRLTASAARTRPRSRPRLSRRSETE
jgi:hypothetical protein